MDIRRVHENCTMHGSMIGLTGSFSAYGSFGAIDGGDKDVATVEVTDGGYRAEYDALKVEIDIKEHEYGVYERCDRLTAKSDIVLNGYSSRWMLENGEYEVYTQHSSWQMESVGGWEELITGIETESLGIRTTDGATPMMAIRNKGNGRIFVLHLMPNAKWRIKVARRSVGGKNDVIVIETGISERGLNMKIAAGEEIRMPRVYFYETENALDLDAWRLHRAFLKDYRRSSLPIVYNTWMSDFDNISFDELALQARACAELGIEYFLIDAGWFGDKAAWSECVGDWEEKENGRLEGRLRELSEYVRGLGLRFGLWIEAERVLKTTKAFAEHTEYYLCGNRNSAFLNFADPDARNYMLGIISSLIDKYSLDIMKFDFNGTIGYDETGSGFYRYFEGQRSFLSELKKKYPSLFLISCASGGYRMDMNGMDLFDSAWYSDNHSFVEGVRIYKDSIKRFLPSAIQKWDVRIFKDKFPKYGNENGATLPLNCNGGTWENVLSVSNSYTYAFLTGGMMGFSADVARYPDEEKQSLKKMIAEYKEVREFYRNASVKVLYDTKSITALQYFDEAMDNAIIQIFCNDLFQRYVTVYPYLDKDGEYLQDESTVSGRELCEKGITVRVRDYTAIEIKLQRKA